MGKRICQFGVEHGRCRCMCPDKEIACDVPEEHGKRDPKEPVKPTGHPMSGPKYDAETTDPRVVISDLLDLVRELTRQRNDARDLAVRSGIFESDHDPKVAGRDALVAKARAIVGGES